MHTDQKPTQAPSCAGTSGAPDACRAAGADALPVIEVIGLGQDRAPVQAEAGRAVAQAQVLGGGRRVLDWFADHPARQVVLSAPLDQALDALDQARRAGLRVAVLTGGDPLFFGLGARLLKRFGAHALRFHPGVTTVQAAAARLGMTWNDLPVVSLHGRDNPGPLLAALARHGACAVYTDAVNTPAALARLFLAQGMEQAELAVCEDLGHDEERVRVLAAPVASGLEFSPLNLVVVRCPFGPDGGPMLGRPDDWYRHHKGLITKWPVRACALAALRLRPDSVLWDVGAGCGAVSVEACALAAFGRVFAVERKPERVLAIRENVRRSSAWQVSVVQGRAPQALEGLPRPDRIFLGGSLGSGVEALEALCEALSPGGRLVANTVLVSSLGRALDHFARLGWACETAQVQASLAAPLAADVQFKALNPVFVIAAEKPDRASAA